MTLPPPAYITSGPHLSGYRVTLGYSTLAEAHDAHSFLATTANSVGTKAPLGRSETSPELWAVGSWLSAALDDPKVCAEMKRDINEWFDGNGHHRPSPPSLVDQEGVREAVARAAAAADGVSWADGIITFRHVPEAESDRDGTHKYYRMADAILQALAVMSPRIEQDQGRDTQGAEG